MEIEINRGELTQIPFSISDSAAGLSGKRVTWSLALTAGGARVLRKESGLPGSTAAVTISTQTSTAITGFLNIALADFSTLADPAYVASMWVDDGAGSDKCVTPNGVDTVKIVLTVARAA